MWFYDFQGIFTYSILPHVNFITNFKVRKKGIFAPQFVSEQTIIILSIVFWYNIYTDHKSKNLKLQNNRMGEKTKN